MRRQQYCLGSLLVEVAVLKDSQANEIIRHVPRPTHKHKLHLGKLLGSSGYSVVPRPKDRACPPNSVRTLESARFN